MRRESGGTLISPGHSAPNAVPAMPFLAFPPLFPDFKCARQFSNASTLRPKCRTWLWTLALGHVSAERFCRHHALGLAPHIYYTKLSVWPARVPHDAHTLT